MWYNEKGIAFGFRERCVQTLTLPLVSSVIFPVFLKNFKPRFPNLQNGANDTCLSEC